MSENLLYQTHVVIQLDNIQKNVERIMKQVAPSKVLLAVKANGYGHGAIEVSRMAESIGVNWLGVATVPEGIELREAGIKLPIIKFSPAFEQELKAALDHDITLTVCERSNIAALNGIGKNCRVHLKIDTGMGRIGCSIDEAVELAQFIEEGCKNLHLEGVMTHLPASDTPEQNSFTTDQICRFKSVVEDIESKLNRKIELVHAANSGAILGHKMSFMNMVRPGIMIYGYRPDPSTPDTVPLYPGLSFYTKVSFVKRVKKGVSIGYGRSWNAPEDGYVATIPAGYADGFKPSLLQYGKSFDWAGELSHCWTSLYGSVNGLVGR